MRAAIVGITLLVTSPIGALAYETDVHYGLSTWLALMAGFQKDEAAIIGNANQDMDRDQPIGGVRHDAVHVVIDEIIFESNDQDRLKASQRVQHDHFRSEIGPAAPAKDRRVKPALSMEDAKRFFKPLLDTNIDATTVGGWLKEVGHTLHAYQDSWSHQGIPDIPASPLVSFRSGYSWGHPDARGGWFRHRADVTCADNDSVISMARNSLSNLKALCAHRMGRPCVPLDESNFENRVKDFSSAYTRPLKTDWFNGEKLKGVDVGNIDLLDGVDLPATNYRRMTQLEHDTCGKVTRTVKWDRPYAARLSQAAERDQWGFYRAASRNWCADPGFIRTLGGFTEWWLSGLGTDTLTQYESQKSVNLAPKLWTFFDRDSISGEVKQWAPSVGDDPVQEWSIGFLRMWLAPDHGLIEALGHGNPRDPNYKNFLSALEFASRGDGGDIDGEMRQALRFFPDKPIIKDTTFREVAGAVEGLNEACGVNVVFKHAPRDSVSLIFQRRSDDWKIVRVSWLSL